MPDWAQSSRFGRDYTCFGRNNFRLGGKIPVLAQLYLFYAEASRASCGLISFVDPANIRSGAGARLLSGMQSGLRA